MNKERTELDRQLNELREAKCSIPDCDEKQFMYTEMNGLLLPFCEEHFIKLLELKIKWDKTSREVLRQLQKSKGEYVQINTFEEFKEKSKPEFFAVATQGLELTKGKCLECGRKAVLIVSFLKPVCEKHAEFPRMVDKVALKEEPLTYIG